MSLGYCYTLLLVFIAVVSGLVVNEIKKVGDEALFKPDITTSLKDTSITWKYTDGPNVIKVIEWDNDFKTLESLNPKFKAHVTLNKTNGELNITDLQLNHAGLYTIEINNKEQEKKIKLIVMEGVPKPPLISEETDNDNARYLRCKYNTKFNIRWKCTHGEIPQKTDKEKPDQEEAITFKRSGNPDVCCTCIVFNDVSEESSNEICRKVLFADPGNSGEIIVGILIPFFLFILLILIIPLYLYVKPVYDCVHPLCENKPCVGGIVNSLERFRPERFRPKPTSEPQSNSNTNGNADQASGANAGNTTATDPAGKPLLNKVVAKVEEN